MDNNYFKEVYGIDRGDVLKSIFLPLGKLITPDIVVNGVFSLPSEFEVEGEDSSLTIYGDYNTVRIKTAKDSFSTFNYDFLIKYFDGNKLPCSLVDCGDDIEIGFKFESNSEPKMLFARYKRLLARKGVLLSFKSIISSKEIRYRFISDTCEEDMLFSTKLLLICDGHKIVDYI